MTHPTAYWLDWIFAILAFIAMVCIFIRAYQTSDDRRGLILKWLLTLLVGGGGFWLALQLGPAGPFVIVVIAVLFSFMWTPAIGDFISKPLTDIFDGGNATADLKPLYSIAMAKRNRGLYHEAILAIREQLARFPNDMEGIMLLAGIQAQDMRDMQAAALTLTRFCAHPRVPPGQFAAAMTHLADWHLQVGQDVDAARAALEKITSRYPETELALVAAQRIAHLAQAEQMLLAKHDPQVIALPKGLDNVGLMVSSESLRAEEEDPAKLADAYVKHLEQHPLDTEAREKLAVIYADHYQRLDMAVSELEQMINQPNHPPKRAAHWLTLLANLQIRHGTNYDTVHATLERIVTSFPNLPVAHSARIRLTHLKLEMKSQQEAPPAKELGVYEQNIGLTMKRKPPGHR